MGGRIAGWSVFVCVCVCAYVCVCGVCVCVCVWGGGGGGVWIVGGCLVECAVSAVSFHY